MKPPLSARKQSAPLTPPQQLSLHPPLYILFSEDKLPNIHTQNTHIHSKRRHTLNSIHTTKQFFIHIHTQAQFYLLTRRPHGLAANKGEKYPLTLQPIPQNAHYPPAIPPTTTSPCTNLIPKKTARRTWPHSCASSWGSSLLRQGAPSSPPATSLQHR